MNDIVLLRSGYLIKYISVNKAVYMNYIKYFDNLIDMINKLDVPYKFQQPNKNVRSWLLRINNLIYVTLDPCRKILIYDDFDENINFNLNASGLNLIKNHINIKLKTLR